jgi:hypothetical protein
MFDIRRREFAECGYSREPVWQGVAANYGVGAQARGAHSHENA